MYFLLSAIILTERIYILLTTTISTLNDFSGRLLPYICLRSVFGKEFEHVSTIAQGIKLSMKYFV